MGGKRCLQQQSQPRIAGPRRLVMPQITSDTRPLGSLGYGYCWRLGGNCLAETLDFLAQHLSFEYLGSGVRMPVVNRRVSSRLPPLMFLLPFYLFFDSAVVRFRGCVRHFEGRCKKKDRVGCSNGCFTGHMLDDGLFTGGIASQWSLFVHLPHILVFL